MRCATLFLAVLVASCGTANVPKQTSNPHAGKSDAVRAGAKLFRAHCAACHGAAADGHRNAPSLKTPSVQDRSDAALFAFLTNGNLKRGMPSWSRLPDERRWQLIAYLRSLGT